MNLRDAVCALLAQAREAGGNVVSIAAVEGVLDRYDREQEADVPMNRDTRLHLAAANADRLYDNASGMTLLKPTGSNGHANRRAQLKVVERLLLERWIVRLDDGRYQATDLGRAQLAAAQP